MYYTSLLVSVSEYGTRRYCFPASSHCIMCEYPTVPQEAPGSNADHL
jgi:hypothetical protein